MPMSRIALGATYRLQAREVGHPTVVAEAVTVDYTCTPGVDMAAGAYQRALVWVYEAARETRYPVNPRDLVAVKP
jgi:hypothetical protein